jgi:hypothetical protein
VLTVFVSYDDMAALGTYLIGEQHAQGLRIDSMRLEFFGCWLDQ